MIEINRGGLGSCDSPVEEGPGALHPSHIRGHAAHERVANLIRGEHHEYAEVIDFLRHLLERIARGYCEADFPLLSVLLYYLDSFPRTLHHPKEDRYLFSAIRRHAPVFRPALDDLEAEHEADPDSLAGLYRLLVLAQAGAPDAMSRFAQAVEGYADFLRRHMAKEEALLDDASLELSPEVWEAIAAELQKDAESTVGAARAHEFALLHRRIVNLLPRKMRPMHESDEPQQDPRQPQG